MQRMNVPLALNVFHPSTTSTLLSLPETNVTGMWCDVFSKWIRIMNVKNCTKGIHKRDSFSAPIRNMDSLSIEFLNDFVVWLENSQDVITDKQKFTKDTMNAALHTTKTFIDFCRVSLEEYGLQFVLSGKLTTDALEGRFRLYRLMNGCNYHISFNQVNIYEHY